MSVIFWFSGTGNSLYAAKTLKAGLGDGALYPMKDGAPQGVVGGNGDKVGFVFPSYYGNLPRIVHSFLERPEIAPESYIYAIVTMGFIGQGSIAAFESVLRKRNLRLDYGRGIRMPANYVIRYNPADPNKSESVLNQAAERIGRASLDIAAMVHSVNKIRFSTNNLYKNTDSLDAKFLAESSCSGCGQCAQVCPVKNIQIDSGKPRWLHRCEHCVACISWCPRQAIQYGHRTKARRRYQNPRINVDELTAE